jgi:hypothetical protein
MPGLAYKGQARPYSMPTRPTAKKGLEMGVEGGSCLRSGAAQFEVKAAHTLLQNRKA